MTSQRGMTLVELLVVVAIMMLLVAVGAPMLRPMLEKQGASQGAQSLRVMLLRARNMAVEKGMPFALRLERVQDVNVGSTHAAVKLSIWRESPTIGTAHDLAAHIDATTNVVTLYDSNGTTHILGGPACPNCPHCPLFSLPPANHPIPCTHCPFYPFCPPPKDIQVQFFGSGEIYTVNGAQFVNELNIPATNMPGNFNSVNPNPAPIFIVNQQPPWLPTSVPPLLMPEGICVDLEFSGIGKSGTQFTGLLDDVLVWFRSDGSVDRVDCANATSGNVSMSNQCDGLVHFLVGSWEQISQNKGVLSEDNRSNLELPANIWVTLDPRSGRVVINEIKVPRDSDPTNDVDEARTFANEIWNEVAAPR